MSENWAFHPTRLPIVSPRAPRSLPGRPRRKGAFRVAPHPELHDAWLLALRTVSGDPAELPGLARMALRSRSPEPLSPLHGSGTGPVAQLLRDLVVRRRGGTGPAPADRPAWQSPYGPPPHRTHRGRWAPVPGVGKSLAVERRGYARSRID